MICYLSTKTDMGEQNDPPLPMFVQYATASAEPVKKFRIQPHGNVTKSTRPFTSTVPAVLERVRVSFKKIDDHESPRWNSIFSLNR
ncbi:unnamed protein product [Rotaria sp. Silwood2]|nr:unnamed protein product [Rotaria sp. Silwood2]CAF3080784.1 unnamed protein product [Rotaria sp. Silwood2]CAF3495086.1 unnamed protein product [Rotaria sp. Silwood2]CAF4190628.1 unnamed protein product [Rotaria sp. Silwood2]CAF4325057.1 unnamed protein product [Rotaria sp. Silwood2]